MDDLRFKDLHHGAHGGVVGSQDVGDGVRIGIHQANFFDRVGGALRRSGDGFLRKRRESDLDRFFRGAALRAEVVDAVKFPEICACGIRHQFQDVRDRLIFDGEGDVSIDGASALDNDIDSGLLFDQPDRGFERRFRQIEIDGRVRQHIRVSPLLTVIGLRIHSTADQQGRAQRPGDD